jgi:hypothetical protein
MLNSVTKGGSQKLPKTFEIVDMTIHWKALVEHFLIVKLVLGENTGMHFLNLSQKRLTQARTIFFFRRKNHDFFPHL